MSLETFNEFLFVGWHLEILYDLISLPRDGDVIFLVSFISVCFTREISEANTSANSVTENLLFDIFSISNGVEKSLHVFFSALWLETLYPTVDNFFFVHILAAAHTR